MNTERESLFVEHLSEIPLRLSAANSFRSLSIEREVINL